MILPEMKKINYSYELQNFELKLFAGRQPKEICF